MDLTEVIGWGYLSIVLKFFVEGVFASQLQAIGMKYQLADISKPLAMGNQHHAQEPSGHVNHVLQADSRLYKNGGSSGQRGQQQLEREQQSLFLGGKKSYLKYFKGVKGNKVYLQKNNKVYPL